MIPNINGRTNVGNNNLVLKRMARFDPSRPILVPVVAVPVLLCPALWLGYTSISTIYDGNFFQQLKD